MIEDITVSIKLCVALFSANFLSLAPIALAIVEDAAAPIPLPNPTRMKNNGATKPRAANRFGPSPDTQIVSARL